MIFHTLQVPMNSTPDTPTTYLGWQHRLCVSTNDGRTEWKTGIVTRIIDVADLGVRLVTIGVE